MKTLTISILFLVIMTRKHKSPTTSNASQECSKNKKFKATAKKAVKLKINFSVYFSGRSTNFWIKADSIYS